MVGVGGGVLCIRKHVKNFLSVCEVVITRDSLRIHIQTSHGKGLDNIVKTKNCRDYIINTGYTYSGSLDT